MHRLLSLVFVLMSAMTLEAACVYEQLVKGENLPIGTMITWSTSFEENNSMFIVEKSEDGINFSGVGTVEGRGDSEDVSNYNFLDVMSNNEKTMYRLKQVDNDGSFSFSDVVTVVREFKNDYMVARMSAVTTTDLFEFTIDALTDGELNYSLANLKGEVIFTEQMIIVNGLNTVSVDLADQSEGIYKLNMEMNGEKEELVVKRVLDEIVKKQNMASKNSFNDGRN